MAIDTALTAWALSNAHELGLEITSFDYISDWITGYHDIETVFRIRGQRFKGRAIAPNQSLALFKALMECVERVSHRSSGYANSSGFAAHTSCTEAQIGAAVEILERDAVLRHHIDARPFAAISDHRVIEALPAVIQTQKIAESLGLSISFYEAEARLSNVRVVVCSVKHATSSRRVCGFGAAWENSSDACLDAAIRKSMLECLRNVPSLIDSSLPESTSSFDLRVKRTWTALDHSMLTLNSEYARSIEPLFCPSHPIRNSLKESESAYSNFQFEEIPLTPEFSELSEFVKVVRATNRSLVALSFGAEAHRNPDGLMHFFG